MCQIISNCVNKEMQELEGELIGGGILDFKLATEIRLILCIG